MRTFRPLTLWRHIFVNVNLPLALVVSYLVQILQEVIQLLKVSRGLDTLLYYKPPKPQSDIGRRYFTGPLFALHLDVCVHEVNTRK